MIRFLTILLSALVAISLFGVRVEKEMTFADGYNGASLGSTESVSIDFARKTDDEIMISGGLPHYCDRSDRKNPCANVAGATVLGYYDKTYAELIENFSSARVIRGRVLYAAQSKEVDDVVARLYVTMKTNVTEGGTTITNFKNGLKEYVHGQGLNISYSQTVSSYTLNLNLYKAAISEEKLVVLFCSNYSMVSLQAFDAESGTEEFTIQHYVGNHVVVGYGVRTIKYYNASGKLINTLNLLAVATGFRHSPVGYILLDNYGTIIDGYEVNIY